MPAFHSFRLADSGEMFTSPVAPGLVFWRETLLTKGNEVLAVVK